MHVCMEEETIQRLDLQFPGLVQEVDGKDPLQIIQTPTEIPGEDSHQLLLPINVTSHLRSNRWMSNVATG